ncbi:D site-binding protein [Papilio xuthus]|uniref:D site-binding protein n=1 Tax=Papilio xuthus TaxID=66420 RepID=A0A0N1I339_PAPXU|nr:D site-binding protein [Papilio xuthus]
MDSNVPLYDLESMSCTAQHSSALAALRLLRSYNHFLVPPDVHGVVPLLASLPQTPCLPSYCQHLPVRTPHVHGVVPLLASLPQTPCLPAYCQHLPVRTPLLSPASLSDVEIRRRGEKRPIPAELKDEKYFERRRRNNQAAKKSRDARRVREDQIAWRACYLEQENASLRAHVAALRQEALALRALLSQPAHAHCVLDTSPQETRIHSHSCTLDSQGAPTSTTAD